MWLFRMVDSNGGEKKHDVYRSKDCTKKFCKYLKEHAMKIINLVPLKKTKNNMVPLTKKYLKNILVKKNLAFVKNILNANTLRLKKYCKVRGNYHGTGQYTSTGNSIFFNIKYTKCFCSFSLWIKL